MTREEAIAYFKRHLDLYCVEGISRESEEMAIKALEQKSCENAIDRAEAMMEIMMFAGNVKFDEEDIYIKVSDVVQLLRELPPITPKGVTITDFADKCRECGKQRKGKWIPIPFALDYKSDAKCSVCHDNFIDAINYNYCPKCGAKMVESEEE